ncbi:polysaccharide deacetylase family protein [Streptomyces crystallinus]|uniref:NodB homology domain-containing protein n=1 Tax=Streptomyces crystallinus TaxID=68191 RepID=A0ABP3QMJ5_9ACTN
MNPAPIPRRTGLLALAALAVTPSAVAAPLGPLPRPTTPWPKESLRRIPTRRRVVALTFNAAWNEAGLDTVLSVLSHHGLPATFFVTGQFAERHTCAMRTIAAAGHGIGNHSYSHPDYRHITRAQGQSDMDRADRAIRKAIDAPPAPFFRFPYSEPTANGIVDANARGWTNVEFTTDTRGYVGRTGGMTVALAAARAAETLAPGQILQMHVGTPDEQRPEPVLDALALPRIIRHLHANDYRVGDLRTLLARRPVT